jgi:hypothetical protein
LVFFELIDNTGLQPLFKTGVLLSFFDTNTRNHSTSPNYLSDLEQFLPVCSGRQVGGLGFWFQGIFYFKRTIMIWK